MSKLTRDDLYSLEEYDRIRNDFRTEVMAHKKNRRLPIGPNATLYFEDRKTMQYQIQEMLRAERIFRAAGIQDELDTYNPLIPEGSNWKATFMVEFEDAGERRKQLAKMINIENSVWLQVDGFDRVTPFADEDLERATEDKTSSVHFLRFELDDDMIKALKNGASLSAGIDHDAYRYSIEPVPDNILQSLLKNLD